MSCGTTGSDVIYANGGNDIVFAGNGADQVYGGEGKDTLKGGGGADYLVGGNGDDTLVGGTEQDVLTGGSGKDTFQFYYGDSWATTATADHITDFRPGMFADGDTLDVSDCVMSHATWGDNYIKASSVEDAQSMANSLAKHYGYGSALYHSTNGKDVYVLMDMNGDKYMETAVVLDNLPNANLDYLGDNPGWIFS